MVLQDDMLGERSVFCKSRGDKNKGKCTELTAIADAKQEGVVCCEVWVVSNEQEIVIGVWVIGDVAHITLTPSILSLLCNMFP